jgi:hypothetical protein
MRCGSTYRVEIDHIVARARGEFGREYQWMPRNLQVLCREHNQEKMTKFDDWHPLWARVLMPVRDTPAVHRAETLAALSPDEYRRSYAITPLRVVQGRLLVSCLTVPRQHAAILRAQQPRTRRPEQALAFAENYGQAGDNSVGCRCCPDGGVDFLLIARLQMALVIQQAGSFGLSSRWSGRPGKARSPQTCWGSSERLARWVLRSNFS